MNTALSYRKSLTKNKGIDTYQQNTVLNLRPTELILKLYDLAIVSIKKGDITKSNLVLTELIGSLNFEYHEVSLGLFRLYRYCQECLYKGNISQALKIIEDLRESWAQAFKLF